jgi:hypothetical protein
MGMSSTASLWVADGRGEGARLVMISSPVTPWPFFIDIVKAVVI